ncbi:cytochrome P450 [Ideonella paludis]|uniref:Cytochrome P450 n=1 Tax=Ideonella paludis TaxID=1233411 RepID=A0ABS5DTE9_9BURK|nr:cytochrome P450 [Ideonella paludis]MBQ0934161.1 cytochrome P450 [Ideonella paludis]
MDTPSQPAALPPHHAATPLAGPARRWGGLNLLLAMRRDYLGLMDGLHRAHGDISLMKIFNEQAYDLMSPDLVREALITQSEHLVRWQRGVAVFADALGQNVLTTEGALWQRQRRMLMPAFTPKRVAGYAALMVQAGHQGLNALATSPSREHTMDTVWNRMTIEVILRTLFGEARPGEADAAMHATQVLSATAFKEMFWPVTLPDWLPLPGKAAKRAALRTLRQLINGRIEERLAQAQPTSTDLLGQLLALRDEDGQALSRQEVFDQCVVTFQAGHETSSTALLWWSALMARHPEAQARARQEVRSLLGPRDPCAEDMAQLPWLSATLKEAMRLYPPVAALMSRRTTAPITLGGWAIPQGAMLRITPWVLHRDARTFPEPQAFRPERFMAPAEAPPKGAYIPLGLGPRVCLGQHFATLEMTLLAAMMLQRFELRWPEGAAEPVPQMHVTLRPKGGLRLVVASA